MLSKLSIKLLIPNLAIGLIFIISLIFIGDSVSNFALVLLFCTLLALQSMASYFFFTKILTNRLIRLKTYLDMVVSTEEAPSEPLKDLVNDDLAQVTNELSDFIVGLADVVSVIRQEAEILRQGSTSLSFQMTDSVNLVENSTGQISQMAESIEDVVNTSSSLSNSAEQVSETTSSVMDILAKELTLLQEESARIGSVLDVIKGIADQTNLLALNAAIEAARAGEQGRGFAVVADEVRALAHRTQQSTVEIQSMVEGLQAKTTNAVNSIGRGHKPTQDSLNYSADVVIALDQIGLAFQDVDNLTSQIASGTLAQQSATSSINDSILAVVSLSHDINSGLNSVAAHAEQQQTAQDVEITLNRICV